MAERAANELGLNVTIIDRRNHLGGNAYSEFEPETGIEYHRYGAHLFHTSNEVVWEYVNRFTAFTDYVHRVYSTHRGEVFPMPVNLGTINSSSAPPTPPSRPGADRRAGRRTRRQGADELRREGHLPDRTPALRGVLHELHRQAVADRPGEAGAGDHLPAAVRFTYDNRYFSDTYEGLPVDAMPRGWNEWPTIPIEVKLDTDFFDTTQPLNKAAVVGNVPVVFTGPVDRYFADQLGHCRGAPSTSRSRCCRRRTSRAPR